MIARMITIMISNDDDDGNGNDDDVNDNEYGMKSLQYAFLISAVSGSHKLGNSCIYTYIHTYIHTYIKPCIHIYI